MTWNIHSCVGGDARFAPDRIADVIRSLDSDIVGLQEIGWHHRGEIGLDQFDYLARHTGLHAVAGPTKHSERAHYGNALLLRLPVLAVRPFDLTIGHREPRGAVEADIRAGTRDLRVIVAHLGLDPWERKAQIARILARIAAAPGLPTIFMGDLNEWTGRSPRLRQLEHGFSAWAAPRSFPARLPALRLDRIFVSGGLGLGPAEAVLNPLTRRASDHLPVRATVTVTAGADSTPAGSAA